MAECWKCAKEESCEWATPREIICSGFTQRKRTNYDRIIQKMPEELAKWLSCNCTGDGYGNSAEDWLDWLRQEARE